MGYRKEDYIKVNEELAERRRRAEADAERRLDEIHAEIPQIAAIDRALSATGSKIIAAISGERDSLGDRIAAVEAENLALQRSRAELLEQNGYPSDYTEARYSCPECGDTGFVGRVECVCRKRLLTLAGYESSGIGELLKTQTFDSFSLDYNGDCASTARNLNAVRAFAESFTGNGDGSLLFIGGTGLGKTHLSTAAAGVLIERGFDVKYEKAQNLIARFEDRQFRRSDRADDETERFFECDLLIIDDLGTEMANSFAVGCLYNVIDTRISRRKSMIINTNLTPQELRRRYADRITSRLFGEFSALIFEGRDVRAEKLRANRQKNT